MPKDELTQTKIRYGFQSPEAAVFPPIIVLENTNVCNLRCIHCPQAHGYPERQDFYAHYMDWEIYKKAIDEIAEHKINHLRFSPAGEALIHPQILDQLAYAKAKGISPLNLTTNGLTLDNPAVAQGSKIPGKSISDRLLELGVDIIDISLDAVSKEKYESIRQWSKYHRVWGNIHRLLYMREKINAPTKIMLSIVDQPESHEELEAFVHYWTPLVDRVIVRPYLENLGLTPGKPDTLVEQLQGIERWPCPQFWKRVTITPEGHIRFCVVDWLDKSVLGNLETHSIKEVWQNAEYERLRGCHFRGDYQAAHDMCGPCTDWMGMRWEWGFEVAVGAVLGQKEIPSKPPVLNVLS